MPDMREHCASLFFTHVNGQLITHYKDKWRLELKSPRHDDKHIVLSWPELYGVPGLENIKDVTLSGNDLIRAMQQIKFL